MRPHQLTQFLLALVLLAACSAPAAALPTTPPAPAVTLPDVIPSRGLVYMSLPERGTPDADPTVTIIGFVVDRDTGAPVSAAVYLFRDQVRREPQPADLVVSDVADFFVKLPADFSGRLVVRAEGYRDWEVMLEHHVKTSRTMKGPVQLMPMTAEGI